MKRRTKADLEQTIKLQAETIELMQKRINELQNQLMKKIEESPIYQRAITDAKIAQEVADMYRSMCEQAS